MENRKKLVDVAHELYPEENFANNLMSHPKWHTEWCFGIDFYDFWRKNHVKLIEADKLYIDYSYQRNTISKTLINDYCREFNTLAINPLRVDDKTFNIIDGQHTGIICVRRGLTLLPVIFINHIDNISEAQLFLQYNKKCNIVRNIDKFKAMLAADDIIAKDTAAIINNMGCEVKRNASRYNHINYVMCIYNAILENYPNTESIAGALRCTILLTESETTSLREVFLGCFYLIKHGFDLKHAMSSLIKKAHSFSEKNAHNYLFRKYREYRVNFCLRSSSHDENTGKIMANVIITTLNLNQKKNIYSIPEIQ